VAVTFQGSSRVMASDRTGERWFDAELHRLKGKAGIRREGARTKAAIKDLAIAVDVAHKQGSKMFELRSAVSFAEATTDVKQQADTMKRIEALLKEIDAEDTEYDIGLARAFLAGGTQNSD